MLALSVALALAAGASAPAEESAPTTGPPAPVGSDATALPPVAHMHAGSMKMGFLSQHPAETAMINGASVTYEKIVILADAINIADSYYPGTTVLTLEHGRISPGPNGPTPTRVSFDTRRTQLPRAAFRGLLTPVSAIIDRMPFDALHPLQVHFKVVMNDLGNFAGSFRHGDEWIPYSGWADHCSIVTVADITARGLGMQRMESITFYGSPAPASRRSELHRASQPSLDPKAATGQDASSLVSEQTVNFSPDGQVKDMTVSSDWEGDPGFMMLPRRGASEPGDSPKSK